MKKIVFTVLIAAAFASCSQTSAPAPEEAAPKAQKVLTPEEEFEARITDLKKKFKRRDANKDSLQAVYDAYLHDQAKLHMGEKLGLEITRSMAIDFNSRQLDSVMNLCELYKSDPQIMHLHKASKAAEATAPGTRFIDIAGEDCRNNKPNKLSSLIRNGKPSVVNFWSSWSIPGRDEIRKYIYELNANYGSRVNFVSIAVWEDSITFTHRATSELDMNWPCLYTGGKENSPTEAYGILGIPHVLLIGSDGIIKARGLRGNEIEAALKKELKR